MVFEHTRSTGAIPKPEREINLRRRSTLRGGRATSTVAPHGPRGGTVLIRTSLVSALGTDLRAPRKKRVGSEVVRFERDRPPNPADGGGSTVEGTGAGRKGNKCGLKRANFPGTNEAVTLVEPNGLCRW